MDELHAVTRGLAEMRRLGIRAVPFDGPQIEPRGVCSSHERDVRQTLDSAPSHDLGTGEVVAMRASELTNDGN
jgi:hypothetical protein